jgi:DNA repair and recombination protein RAD52
MTPEQIKELQKPLDPKHVVKPTGQFGAKGDYIEGWHAINEANRIFGFDGWSYTIQLTQDSLVHGKDSKNNPQWQGVGFGSGFAKQIGDAIEGATKEAETDALKRALRTFGNVFGLALYDKSRAAVGAPETKVPESVRLMVDGLKAATANGDAGEYWKSHWPAVAKEWRPYVLAEKEKLKEPNNA